ncbi:recombinase family protein [Taibaiella chishuiensis]
MTRWDRFCRNAGDAYYMIATLKKLNVEVQAIEQPLHLSVSENKMILALYLATSEVENDRRALNIKQGIHKAKQEGRWTSHAPKGYVKKYRP